MPSPHTIKNQCFIFKINTERHNKERKINKIGRYYIYLYTKKDIEKDKELIYV